MNMANAHQASDLKALQSLPLETKIQMTKQRIRVWYESWVRFEIEDLKTGKIRYQTFDVRQWYEPPLGENEVVNSAYPGWVYVSFSGGKDSTVLKHIVDSMYDDVPAVFVNTGLEYPEIQRFVKDVKAGEWDCFNTNVEIVRPEMRFDEVLKTHGYPVISKEVSETISQARKNAKTGKYTYRLKKLNGELTDKDGNSSQYNIPQWKFLLDAPYDISNKCCDLAHETDRPYSSELA